MTELLAWLVFPLIATIVAVGLGLLVDRVVARPLPGVLVAPVGFALLIGVTQLTTWSSGIAPVTPFAVVALTLAGLGLGRGRLRAVRLDRWAAAAGVGAFLAYLAPIGLSGHPGFAGYILLGDTSIHLELAGRIVHHGTDLSGLTPSSYQTSVWAYFNSSYPTGSHGALGALGELVPTDLAWLYQPFLAWMMSLTALSFYELLRPVAPSRPTRALAAFVAAQPGLLYAFAMQGAIKEIATVGTLATTFALMPWLVARPAHWRNAIAVAVATAGALSAIDVAASAWLAPGLLVAVVVLAWRLGRARLVSLAQHVGAFVVVAVLLAGPTVFSATRFLHNTKQILTSSVELGDLQGPIDPLEIFGIWPGDFRLALAKPQYYLLIGVAILAVAFGVVRLLRTARGWALAALAGASLVAYWYITKTGSPWVNAKAMAIFAPAVMLVAFVGAIAVGRRGRRIESAVLLGALTAGVLWTNGLAYHDVALANYPRLHELEQLGHTYAGQGPTFTPEFEEFTKYFLRDAAPVAGSEPYKPGPSVMVPGGALRFGYSIEVGQFDARYVAGFRSIVLRRSPVQSRPPAPFTLVHRGTYYDVWQRPARGAPQILGELSLGNRFQPGARAPCPALRGLAQTASKAGAMLAWAPAPRLVVADPGPAKRSPSWVPDGGDPDTLGGTGPGWVQMTIRVPKAGRYDAWTELSSSRPLTMLVNGRRVTTLPAGLSPRGPGEDDHAGSVELPAGRSVVRYERPGGGLEPGNGSVFTRLGPTSFVLSGSDDRPVRRTPPARWRTLCGRNLDWVEAVS